MLFNSYLFLLCFLPVSFAVYFGIGRVSPRYCVGFLALASIVFYGQWNPWHVPLMLGSALFNWGVAQAMERGTPRWRRSVLIAGVIGDLALLGGYKYLGFAAHAANDLLGAGLPVPEILLPLGISFFTFTQIAFIIDVYRRQATSYSLISYLLFVTYFPHLIAGPIIHHAQVMPQFSGVDAGRIQPENLARGLTFLGVGLFKKCIVADQIAPIADAAFHTAAGGAVDGWTAWTGALAYTLQLYFDFSGYCDMAVGLSLMFNVRLPFNFNSPYKATSIIDFWRRWHMTLSAFLRDYLYFALGGNRKGPARRYVNLMATMVLGGLWHGAGWTFLAWGALHGLYLMIAHGARALRAKVTTAPAGRLERALGWLVTFLAVMVAWVFFRAPELDDAWVMLRGMVGLSGLGAPPGSVSSGVLLIGCAIAWGLPNSQQVILGLDGCPPLLRWRTGHAWAFLTAAMFCFALMAIDQPSRFLYFNF